jgi:hypothetical protein
MGYPLRDPDRPPLSLSSDGRGWPGLAPFPLTASGLAPPFIGSPYTGSRGSALRCRGARGAQLQGCGGGGLAATRP